MNIVTEVKEWQALRKQWGTVGFIPTMGHLHEGHMSLCRRSILENEVTVVSIFVNPTQFNQSADFELYPRTLEHDQALLSSNKVDYLFLPSAESLYPDNYQLKVTETDISAGLEGEFRPGHFDGMLTVVLKLLNIIQPSRAYFGEKDYQQLLLIKKMVDALFVPTEIIACETIRAESGLALSSRNSRLNAEQQEKAAHFPVLLKSVLSSEEVKKKLISLGFKVEYIAERWGRRLGAVWLDNVRLIDNVDYRIKI